MAVTTLALSRWIAIADGRNQQAAMVQCAARLLHGAPPENKIYLLQFIAATPAERQRIVSLTERMFLTMGVRE